LVVRLLAGSAGVIVALVAVVFSLGAAIGAPFGMYFVAPVPVRLVLLKSY